MSLLLTSCGKNLERRPGNGLCSYCNKMFKDPRALGGHLRAHWGQAVARKIWNTPALSSNYLNITKAMPNPLMATQSLKGSGNNQSTAFGKAARPPIFPIRFGYENWVNDSKFPEESIGNAKTPFSVSANFSSGCEKGEICHFQSWSCQVSAPSCCINPNSVPLNHSFPSGLDAIFQYNTDPSQSFGDGGQSSVNILPCIQYKNQGTYPDPCLGLNQRPVFRRTSNVGPFFTYQNQHPSQGESCGYNNNHILTHGGKRHYSGEAPQMTAMMNPLKRPRTDCNLMIEVEEHQKNDMKERLLFKDVENPVSGLGISLDANGEPQTDLDLSLHL